MRVTISFAFAFAMLGGARVARGDGHELAIGQAARSLRSSSADAVATASLDGGVVSYAHDLGLALAPRLSLWAIGDLEWASTTGTLFQTMTTEVDTIALGGGARLRYAPYRRLAATARVVIGSARTALVVRDASGNAARDAGWAGLATAAAGLDLMAIAGRSFALGVRAELGYTAARAVPLTPTSDHGGSAVRLPMTEAGIGHLDLSGPFVAIAVIAQF